MTQLELCADRLARSLELVKMTLADFTDDDMLVRPGDGANHAAWQIGHLIASEARMIGGAKGQSPQLPPGLAEKFTKETAASNDAAAFPTKEQLLEGLTKVRSGSIEWTRSLKPEQFGQSGPERIRAIAPTLEHLPILIVEHTAMHVGQFQVIRRKLGKPVLF
jgi:hypothetical protein